MAVLKTGTRGASPWPTARTRPNRRQGAVLSRPGANDQGEEAPAPAPKDSKGVIYIIPKEIECKTQAEFDLCIKAGNRAIVREGYFEATLNAQVTAYDSSQVRATGNVFIRLLGALSIKASASVVIMAHVKEKAVEGGQVIWAATAETPEAWCDLYGVEVKDGVATVYKALNDNFTSPHGMSYAPGSTPVANDWDGGKRECGGGLHFSPSPAQALTFHRDAKRFVTCYVRLADMRAPQPGDDHPEKIKASGCCAPCVECDIHGNAIETKKAA